MPALVGGRDGAAMTQRLNVDGIERRRRRIVGAVIAVFDHMEGCMGGGQPVLPFHVKHFGLPECEGALGLDVIARELRWLADRGLVERAEWNGRRAYLPTTEGRAWVADSSGIVSGPETRGGDGDDG